MSRTRLAAVMILASFVLVRRPAAQDQTIFVDVNAENIFRLSRSAISGGGGSVTRLKSLIMKGRSRVPGDGGALMSATVTIKMLLPDHYLRVDTFADGEKATGYAGKTVLSSIRANRSIEYPPDSLWPQILRAEKLRVARLMLGATTYISADYALTFSSLGRSGSMIDPRQSARTAASVDSSNPEPLTVNVRGDNFGANMIVDATTHAPRRLVFPGNDRSEVTITFEDRRVTGGLLMPYHINTTAGSRVLDDLRFDEIQVNPELGKGDFTQGKRR